MKRISLILLAALGLLSLGSSCKKQQDVPRLSQVDFSVLEAKTYLPVESSTATVRRRQGPCEGLQLRLLASGSSGRCDDPSYLDRQYQSPVTQRLAGPQDSKGDSIAINIMQAGIIFGLPKEQAMIGGGCCHRQDDQGPLKYHRHLHHLGRLDPAGAQGPAASRHRRREHHGPPPHGLDHRQGGWSR